MKSDESRPAYEGAVTIAASAAEVWRVLVDPDSISRWMIGARVESTWEVGAPIVFHVNLHGKPFRDHGTILELEPGRVLRYDLWSRITRIPDTPGNRAVIGLRLAPTDGGTRLSVRHEPAPAEAALEHAVFFWRVTLEVIRGLVEGTRPA
jgi:uncharacterized protein YndB with AHSA1/START domain